MCHLAPIPQRLAARVRGRGGGVHVRLMVLLQSVDLLGRRGRGAPRHQRQKCDLLRTATHIYACSECRSAFHKRARAESYGTRRYTLIAGTIKCEKDSRPSTPLTTSCLALRGRSHSPDAADVSLRLHSQSVSDYQYSHSLADAAGLNPGGGARPPSAHTEESFAVAAHVDPTHSDACALSQCAPASARSSSPPMAAAAAAAASPSPPPRPPRSQSRAGGRGQRTECSGRRTERAPCLRACGPTSTARSSRSQTTPPSFAFRSRPPA